MSETMSVLDLLAKLRRRGVEFKTCGWMLLIHPPHWLTLAEIDELYASYSAAWLAVELMGDDGDPGGVVSFQESDF